MLLTLISHQRIINFSQFGDFIKTKDELRKGHCDLCFVPPCKLLYPVLFLHPSLEYCHTLETEDGLHI